MKRLICGFLLTWCFAFCEHSMVFVYVGQKIPRYVQTAVDQAAKFNPDCRIYLIGNKKPLGAFRRHGQKENVELVPAESLPISGMHRKFIGQSRLDKRWRQGFWFHTSERFFWIASLMQKKNLSNVVHVESDNMVYVNFGSLMPIFERHYPHVGMVMDCETRCIPSIVFFKSSKDASALCKHFLRAGAKSNDMQVLSSFRNKKGHPFVVELPIMPIDYAVHEDVRSPHGKTTNRPQVFARHFGEFKSIFDGAAIGQYLGGVDPIHKNSKPGFINETSLFNPSRCQFEWEVDGRGRKVPFVIHRGQKFRVNNLHIHCKRLREFQ